MALDRGAWDVPCRHFDIGFAPGAYCPDASWMVSLFAPPFPRCSLAYACGPQYAWRSMPRSHSNSTTRFGPARPAAVPDVRRYSVIIQAAKVLI
jgi:hypothetical protein